MSDFTMPSLGADMTAGTLMEWYVRPGDAVRKGDLVAAVDTSKAEIDIEVFEDGVVGELLVDVGTRVPVGTPIATIVPDGAGAAPAAPPAPPAAPPTPAEPPPPAPPPTDVRRFDPAMREQSVAHPPEGARARVSPLARRVAAQLGVDPASVEGTGPGGAITREDVERAASATQAPPPAAPPAPPPSRPSTPAPPPTPTAERPGPDQRRQSMRKAVGDLMARSAREIPHYHLETHIDLSTALTWLADHNGTRPPPDRAIPATLLLAAAARAAAKHPQLNGFFQDDRPQPAEHVHLGVALALRGGGLIAPAIHDADRLPFAELASKLRDLTARARAGQLRGSDMSEPTITVTSLGDRGADEVHGVIYAPQVALIGFGAIRERPWASDGMVGARRTVVATLAADHRASDGADGSRLLGEIDRLLQSPEELR